MTLLQFANSAVNGLILGAFLMFGWVMWRDFLTSKTDIERLIEGFDRTCSKFEALDARLIELETRMNSYETREGKI